MKATELRVSKNYNYQMNSQTVFEVTYIGIEHSMCVFTYADNHYELSEHHVANQISEIKPKDEAKSSIMSSAWQFFKVTGQSFSECLKLAWANYKLKKALSKGIVRFYFQKIDGTIREAWGTLADKYLPESKASDNRKKNEFTQTYFDTEKGEFRCFKKINLISIA